MSPNQSKASAVPHREACANSLFMKGFFAAAVGGDCPRTVSADNFGQQVRDADMAERWVEQEHQKLKHRWETIVGPHCRTGSRP